ncbi:MAG: bifunctional riboflavin kinase/FAD synthetase [Pseudomonadota bacterium]|nr:bifunctional riboflavin kinase/FAD synthetase [Pseudomonadota bacterium]
MILIQNIDKNVEPGGIFALGNFDGIHLGHKEIIENVKKLAKKNKSYSGVIVFEPHPRKFFMKDKNNFYLSDIKTKKYLLESLGLDSCIVLEFNEKLAKQNPEEFVEEIIFKKIKPSHLIVGYDFRFGNKRSGNSDDLLRLCSKYNISVSIVDKQLKDGTVLSSSIVRDLIQEGDFKKAELLLGHKWLIKGKVIEGDKRGREIGFPTANLNADEIIQLKFGVYAVEVIFDGKSYKGVSNYGIRPTFDGENILLETHLLDFSGDLYGKDIIVSFVKFLREEKKFEGINSLKDQIKKDSEEALNILSK